MSSDPTPTEDVYRAAAEAHDAQFWGMFRPEPASTLRGDVLAANPSFRAAVDAAYAAGRRERTAEGDDHADVAVGATVDAAYDDGFKAGREAAARDIVAKADAAEDDPSAAYHAALDIAEGRGDA